MMLPFKVPADCGIAFVPGGELGKASWPDTTHESSTSAREGVRQTTLVAHTDGIESDCDHDP